MHRQVFSMLYQGGFRFALGFLMLLLFVFSPAIAPAKEPSPKALKLVYCKDCVPFEFINSSGNPDGMVIDKWKLWEQKIGIPIKYIPASWDDTLAFVRNGKAQVHAGLFFSEQRDAFLDYGPPLIRSDTQIFYDKNLPLPGSFKDFKAYRIGLIKGDFVESWLNTHMPELTLVGYDTYDEMMAALDQGEIRVFVADTLTALHYLEKFDLRRQFHFKSNAPIFSSDFFPAVKQGNAGLLKTVIKGMALISEAESKAVYRQWASGIKETDSGALIIAIDRDYPPFTLVDPEGNPSGLLVEMWRLWSETSGLKIKFRPSSWAESIEAVRNGSADIHSGVFKNEVRSQWMAFSQPIHRAQTTLYFNSTEEIISLEALGGQKVGVIEGSHQEAYLKKNFTQINRVHRPDGESLILALLKKDVRAIFHETMAVEADLNQLGLSGKLKQLPESILTNVIYAGVPKYNEDLLPLINEGFSSIPRSELVDLERQWIQRKENRFYSEEAGTLSLTRDEKEFIAGHTSLTFSEANWKPLAITDRPDRFDGMIADYLKVITEKTGLRFKFIQSKTWSEVLNRYRDGVLDMIPALGKEDDPGRSISLSIPFVKFPLVIVTRDDVSYITDTAQLKGRKVAVGRGYTSYQFLKKNYPDIELVQTDDVETGLLQLTNRKVDAFVGHMAVVINAIQASGLTNLKIAGETEYIFEHHIGVDPKYPQAVSIINKALDSMAEPEHQAIYRKWLSVHYEKGMDYQLLAKILGVAFLFIAVIVYWNRRLSREVSERKKTEQRLLENERKTRAMSEAIHDGLVMIDEQARVMYWNHAAETLFDIPAEEAMEKDMHSLFAPEEYRGPAAQGLESFARTGQGPVVGRLQELTAQRRDGTQFPVEVGVSAFQVSDKWFAVGTIRDITERNQAQETVLRIRTELQQIFDSAQVGILFSKSGRHIYRCNNRTAQILGYDSPSLIAGMTLEHVHLTSENFHEFGRQQYGILARGEQVQTEYELKRKDGTGVWCSLSGKALDSESPPDMDKGVIWVIDDITEKRKARKALRQTQERVNTILNSINTGTLIINPSNRTIEDVNPAAARMIGLPREKIIGQSCHRFICPNDEGNCPIIDHLEQIDNAERILLTAEGREVPILKTVVPVMLGDKKQLLESFVDLTGQKEAEKELQRNLKDLERFYQLAIGREEKMIALKQEVNQLLTGLGQKEKYVIR